MSRTADGTTDDLDPTTATLAGRASAALSAYREGQTDLLAELVREASPLLWHIVRSQGVGRDHAEDVVQGVWLAFVRSAATIREPDAVLKWLVVSARRAAWQAAARRREQDRRDEALPEADSPPSRQLRSTEPSPDEALLRRERDRVLWRSYLELPERCRQILRFVAVAARPNYQAIAAATGIPVTSVGVTRGRCLAKLRTVLEQDQGWVAWADQGQDQDQDENRVDRGRVRT